MKRASQPFPWTYFLAPGCLVLGFANLCRVAYYWLYFRTANAWMVGAGIGLTVIGLMATYYAWDDFRDRRRELLPPPEDDEDLSAEDYERRFED